jgi:prepilin-type N-terminal cleavage/methylation domain-containing protein
MYSRLRKALQNKDKGFTLIELLVVIIIIGILAAIAIPIFLSQREKAVDASAKSDVRTLATEMETSYTDNQAYPTTLGAAVPTANGGNSYAVGSDVAVLSPGNTATLTMNTNASAYCLVVSPAPGKGTHPWVWVSSQGGLQSGTIVACPAATAF